MEFVTIFGSAKNPQSKQWQKEAKKLGKLLAKNGFGVITGAGSGIMKAANKGAFKAGGVSIGYGIDLPVQKKQNKFCSHLEIFPDFSSRKVKLMEKSSFFVVFPGGFGTLDELGEILELNQAGMIKSKIILFDSDYWGELLGFLKHKMLKNDLINGLKNLSVCSNAKGVIKEILKHSNHKKETK